MDMEISSIGSLIGASIEWIGVLVIVVGFLIATIGAVRQILRDGKERILDEFRKQIKRDMLLGLDFMVAGDIIRTVTVEPSISGIASLGLLVLVRTVLVFTIHLELEGHWPWQAPPRGGDRDSTEGN